MRNAAVAGVDTEIAPAMSRAFTQEFFIAAKERRVTDIGQMIFICDPNGEQQLCFNKRLRRWAICGGKWVNACCLPQRILYSIADRLFRREAAWETALWKAYASLRSAMHYVMYKATYA